VFNWFFCLLVAQVFDKHNRGYITASDLRAVLQCLGEDLSEEESKSKILTHSLMTHCERDYANNVRRYSLVFLPSLPLSLFLSEILSG